MGKLEKGRLIGNGDSPLKTDEKAFGGVILWVSMPYTFKNEADRKTVQCLKGC